MFAPEYIARATEALAKAGEDGYVLSIETHRVITKDGSAGGTKLVDKATGELAEVKLDGDAVVALTPKANVTWGIGTILRDVLNTEDTDDAT